MNKRLWLYGIIGFGGLLGLSVMFYKERMIFSDAAFYLYTMAKEESFAVFHARFIAIIPQTLPLAGIIKSASLNTIMLLYSASLVWYHLIFFLLASLTDKTGRFAIVILLFNMLIVTEIFFWPLSELTLGISLLLFYFSGLFFFKEKRILQIAVSILLLPVIAFAHPLVILPFSFLLLFFFLRKEISRNSCFTIAALFVTVLILKFTVFRDPYDKGLFDNWRNFIRLFPDYFSLYSNKEFLSRLITSYHVWLLAFVAVVIFYIRQRQWKLLGLTVGFTIACIGLVNVCFPYPHTSDFYRENLYMPITVFVAAPFVFDVLPLIKRKYAPSLIIVLVCIAAFARIYYAHPFFSDRLNWLRAFLKQHQDEKLVISATSEHYERLALTWGTPYEFWLLSTSELGKTASLFIHDTTEPLPEYKGEGDVFLHQFAGEPYRYFPKRYFRFKDTVNGYKATMKVPLFVR